MKHSIVMNATKTRSRYVSLAMVLSNKNTVVKDIPKDFGVGSPVPSDVLGHHIQSDIYFL